MSRDILHLRFPSDPSDFPAEPTIPVEEKDMNATAQPQEGIQHMAGPAQPEPKVGDTVLVYGLMENNSLEHPAMVTRVWGPDTVNVMVSVDMSGTKPIGSVGRLQDGEAVVEGVYRWKFPG